MIARPTQSVEQAIIGVGREASGSSERDYVMIVMIELRVIVVEMEEGEARCKAVQDWGSLDVDEASVGKRWQA